MPMKPKKRLTLGEEPAPIGRPTKYTEKTVKLLEQAVAAGLSNKSACSVAGISQETLSQWRKDRPEFAGQLECAREKAKERALAAIQKAGKTEWRALEAWLKLTSPEYRKNRESLTSLQINSATGASNIAISNEDLAEMRRLRAEAIAARNPTRH